MRWSGTGLKALFGIFELLASLAGMPDVPESEGTVVEVDWNILDFWSSVYWNYPIKADGKLSYKKVVNCHDDKRETKV